MDFRQTPPSHPHTAATAMVANTPYLVMLLLGAASIILGLRSSGAAWGLAAGYVVYGILGALWIILFLCPHCPSFGKWTCPCGYGVLSARLRRQGDTSRFGREFKRHIAVIVPLWIIPLVLGGIGLARGFSWPAAGVLAAFVLNSFVILPLVSRIHGCKDCAQREDCPWMK